MRVHAFRAHLAERRADASRVRFVLGEVLVAAVVIAVLALALGA